MPKLYVKYVKFYEQDRDNFLHNQVTIISEFAFSPGRFKVKWVRIPAAWIGGIPRIERIVKDLVTFRPEPKNDLMIQRLRKRYPIISYL